MQRHDLIDGLLQQLPHIPHGGEGILPVFPDPQFEVAPCVDSLVVADQHASGLQASDVPKRRPAGRARRAQADELAQAAAIQYRLHERRLENRIRMIRKHQRAFAARVEQAALPHAIPTQQQHIPLHIRDAAHAWSLDVPRKVLTPYFVGPQRQRGLGGVGRALQPLRQRAPVAHAPVDQHHSPFIGRRLIARDGHLPLADPGRVAAVQSARTDIRMIRTKIIHSITLPIHIMIVRFGACIRG